MAGIDCQNLLKELNLSSSGSSPFVFPKEISKPHQKLSASGGFPLCFPKEMLKTKNPPPVVPSLYFPKEIYKFHKYCNINFLQNQPFKKL